MKNTYTTSNGVIKQIPEYGTIEYGLYAYELMKINNKGHNYQYWNDEKHSKMLNDGYKLYNFTGKWDERYATTSELTAKEIVKKLRSEGNYARIICGYHKTKQKTKHFSILYKQK